ncbi:MAG: hypothetical protein JOS17DRAFT_781681 [Linnemannia elongata]|nr:MAG: hypothetical protein JOS17DRAFT_781681 [Linnemannia elongata]
MMIRTMSCKNFLKTVSTTTRLMVLAIEPVSKAIKLFCNKRGVEMKEKDAKRIFSALVEDENVHKQHFCGATCPKSKRICMKEEDGKDKKPKSQEIAVDVEVESEDDKNSKSAKRVVLSSSDESSQDEKPPKKTSKKSKQVVSSDDESSDDEVCRATTRTERTLKDSSDKTTDEEQASEEEQAPEEKVSDKEQTSDDRASGGKKLIPNGRGYPMILKENRQWSLIS